MGLGTSVLDLTSVVAALASFGGVSGLLSVLRILFLDRALGGLDATQQNVLLRAVSVALNFAAILGLSLLFGATFGQPLVLSTVLATLGAAGGSHILYTGTKALIDGRPQDTSPSGTYPVYPPDAAQDAPITAAAAAAASDVAGVAL